MAVGEYPCGKVPAIHKMRGNVKKYPCYGDIKPSGNVSEWEFPDMGKPDADVQVEFYVPSTRKVKYLQSDKVFQKRVADTVGFFSRLFGGGTQFAGYGNWINEGKNISEPVGIIRTSTNVESWKRWDTTVRDWIMQKKQSWGQASLMLIINGKSFFV